MRTKYFAVWLALLLGLLAPPAARILAAADPAAAVSLVPNGGFETDKNSVGWQEKVLVVAERHPILVGEVGADIKKMDFIPASAQEDPFTWVPDMLGLIQKHRLHWTAFSFHPSATPVLITGWDYTPTPFWGVFVKEALAGKQFELKKLR